MAIKHGLGRGLGALIGEGRAPQPAAPAAAATATTEGGAAVKVPIDRIAKSVWQPRRTFAPEALQDLVNSIREKGVLQPLLVRRKQDGYELIAGERRFRAAKEAGLTEIPVIVMDVADRESLELALVENLQREDLNVIEEAEGYRALAETFSLTQEEIAARVGKARASVTNTMRLLGLADEVKKMLADSQLSAGHAKVLLGVEIGEEQRQLAQRSVREGLSVRALEKLVEKAKRGPRKIVRATQDDIPASHVTYLTDLLHHHLGTGVRISPSRTLPNGKKSKGTVEIDYYSNDDLNRILQLLGLEDRP